MSKLLLALALLLAGPAAGDEHVNHTVLKKLAWQFAFPSDAVRDDSILIAAHRAHGLGVHHLELVFGQPINSEPMEGLLDASLDDAKAADLLKKLKVIGVDVVSLRADHLQPSDRRAILHLAKTLGAPLVVLPDLEPDSADLAKPFGLKLAIQAGVAKLGDTGGQVGICYHADYPTKNTQDAPITEAAMTDDFAADQRAIEVLQSKQFKGVVTVSPQTRSERATLVAMDAFARALHELPTTLP